MIIIRQTQEFGEKFGDFDVAEAFMLALWHQQWQQETFFSKFHNLSIHHCRIS